MKEFIFFEIVLVAVVAIIIAIPFIIRKNKPLKIRSRSINEKKVYMALVRVSEVLTEEAFGTKFAKRGVQGNAYEKCLESNINDMIEICCSGSRFKDEVCDKIEKAYPKAKIKDITEVLYYYVNDYYRQKSKKEADFLAEIKAISPSEFFGLKDSVNGDLLGAYIIYNSSKNMYYVGQAKRVFFRINQHFTGHGNGEVYADYKYGDEFEIKIVSLQKSGYYDLDKLEMDLINKYNAKECGYNKTSGNQAHA